MFEETMGWPASYLIVAISSARESARVAMQQLNAEGVYGKIAHMCWLNPFSKESWDYIVLAAKQVLGVAVADCTYEPCSIAEHVAYRIASETGTRVRVVGMEPRLSGVAERLENGTPSAERIVRAVKELL